jgi:hypothetical protein
VTHCASFDHEANLDWGDRNLVIPTGGPEWRNLTVVVCCERKLEISGVRHSATLGMTASEPRLQNRVELAVDQIARFESGHP